MRKLITFLGTEADTVSARQFFHLPDWAVNETRTITDDFALSEGFQTAAGLATELETRFPGWFRITDQPAPEPETKAPATPAEKGTK